MELYQLSLPNGVNRMFVANGRGRIAAHVGIDPEIPSDIRSEKEKHAFLQGYHTEFAKPSITKELEHYPTQLSGKAVKAYNKNREEQELLKTLGW